MVPYPKFVRFVKQLWEQAKPPELERALRLAAKLGGLR